MREEEWFVLFLHLDGGVVIVVVVVVFMVDSIVVVIVVGRHGRHGEVKAFFLLTVSTVWPRRCYIVSISSKP